MCVGDSLILPFPNAYKGKTVISQVSAITLAKQLNGNWLTLPYTIRRFFYFTTALFEFSTPIRTSQEHKAIRFST
jgi:hypothetical protein